MPPNNLQVGVVLNEGHPVYFVIFSPNPEPGQTLLDVSEAERQFVHRVRELHPNASKPGIIGNCQAGWAAMMLAAANPDDTGPVVIVGAPMSYWGGAWRDDGDNPMRYAGGLLGGAWLASLASCGPRWQFRRRLAGANFQNLNPASTYLGQVLNLFPHRHRAGALPRIQRWWGGYLPDSTGEIRVDRARSVRRQQACRR